MAKHGSTVNTSPAGVRLGPRTQWFPNWCILFETLFFGNEMRQKYNLCCVLFLKLPSPCMFKMSTTHKMTVAYLGRPHLMRGQVSECRASIFELAKFDEHCISRYQSHENVASITSLGIVKKRTWLHQHSRYHWNFSFFRTDLSTHLAPFQRLQTCLGFLLPLPLLMMG